MRTKEKLKNRNYNSNKMNFDAAIEALRFMSQNYYTFEKNKPMDVDFYISNVGKKHEFHFDDDFNIDGGTRCTNLI